MGEHIPPVRWRQAQRQSNRELSAGAGCQLLEGKASKTSTESLVQTSVLFMVTVENSVSKMVAWGCRIQSVDVFCFDLHSSSFNLLPPIFKVFFFLIGKYLRKFQISVFLKV